MSNSQLMIRSFLSFFQIKILVCDDFFYYLTVMPLEEGQGFGSSGNPIPNKGVDYVLNITVCPP